MSSVEQAICDALATYLTSELTGVTVKSKWRDAGVKLTTPLVTVVKFGVRREIMYDPIVIGQTDELDEEDEPTGRATYKWELSSIEQDLQLDVWAVTQKARDDVMDALTDAMRQGIAVSAPVLGANHDPTRHGVLVPLTGKWAGSYADISMGNPEIFDTPASVGASEYRGTFRALASASLVVSVVSTKMTDPQFSFDELR